MTVGTFVRGDTVLVVGRDDSGDWLQVRNPDDLFARVWVEADLLVPDGEVGDTPVVPCDDAEFLAVEPTDEAVTDVEPSPSPSPSPQESPSPTAEPSPTETTGPSPTPSPSPSPAPTTPPPSPSPDPSPTADPSPTQAPNTPPVISNLSRQHAEIYDESGTQASCPSSGYPTTSIVSVVVDDDRGVDSVQLTLSTNQGSSGPFAMQRSGSTWSYTVGPFGNVGSQPLTLDVDIVATDTDGATDQASTTITVRPCP